VSGVTDADKTIIRRWVATHGDEHKLWNLIVTTFDEGPSRDAARTYANEVLDEGAAQPPRSAPQPGVRPSGPEWVELVRDYRAAVKASGKRPALARVAEEYGWGSEQPLRDRLHKLGIARWHHVHALVASEPG
jgi:hypothetical protein